MAKKTGMGSTPLSWVRDTRTEDTAATEPPPKTSPVVKKRAKREESEAQIRPEEIKNSAEVQKLENSEVPKFETFDIKLSVRLRGDQLELLEKLTRDIMRNRDRANRKERITKNTVVRACLDALREVEFDTVNISDEEELRQRIRVGMGVDS